MSVLEKFKVATEAVEEFAKEKPTVNVVSNCTLTVENYKSVKLFCDDKLLLDLGDINLYIAGEKLFIRSFSPVRLVLEGSIKNISYVFEEDV